MNNPLKSSEQGNSQLRQILDESGMPGASKSQHSIPVGRLYNQGAASATQAALSKPRLPALSEIEEESSDTSLQCAGGCRGEEAAGCNTTSLSCKLLKSSLCTGQTKTNEHNTVARVTDFSQSEEKQADEKSRFSAGEVGEKGLSNPVQCPVSTHHAEAEQAAKKILVEEKPKSHFCILKVEESTSSDSDDSSEVETDQDETSPEPVENLLSIELANVEQQKEYIQEDVKPKSHFCILKVEESEGSEPEENLEYSWHQVEIDQEEMCADPVDNLPSIELADLEQEKNIQEVEKPKSHFCIIKIEESCSDSEPDENMEDSWDHVEIDLEESCPEPKEILPSVDQTTVEQEKKDLLDDEKPKSNICILNVDESEPESETNLPSIEEIEVKLKEKGLPEDEKPTSHFCILKVEESEFPEPVEYFEDSLDIDETDQEENGIHQGNEPMPLSTVRNVQENGEQVEVVPEDNNFQDDSNPISRFHIVKIGKREFAESYESRDECEPVEQEAMDIRENGQPNLIVVKSEESELLDQPAELPTCNAQVENGEQVEAVPRDNTFPEDNHPISRFHIVKIGKRESPESRENGDEFEPVNRETTDCQPHLITVKSEESDLHQPAELPTLTCNDAQVTNGEHVEPVSGLPEDINLISRFHIVKIGKRTFPDSDETRDENKQEEIDFRQDGQPNLINVKTSEEIERHTSTESPTCDARVSIDRNKIAKPVIEEPKSRFRIVTLNRFVTRGRWQCHDFVTCAGNDPWAAEDKKNATMVSPSSVSTSPDCAPIKEQDTLAVQTENRNVETAVIAAGTDKSNFACRLGHEISANC